MKKKRLYGVLQLGMFKTCPTCRKRFYISYTSGEDWAYTRQTRNNRGYFCSWHCLREWDRKRQDKKRADA